LRITLRYFEGCPNWRVAEARLRRVLGEADSSTTEIVLERVESPEEAERLAFRGSPTILVDGLDPFAEDGAPVGLACRMYRTERGLDGAPSEAQLRRALSLR
jgi:hypothetical protein